MWNDSVVTDAGVEILNRAAKGETLTITGAKAGTGYVPLTELFGKTALESEKQTLSIVFMDAVEKGNRFKIQFQAAASGSGYVANQVGVYAQIGEEPEVLLAIFQDKVGVTIPTEDELADFVYTLYAVIAIDNTGKLNVTISPLAFLTMETLTQTTEQMEGIIAQTREEMQAKLDAAQKQAESTVSDAEKRMQSKLTDAQTQVDKSLGDAKTQAEKALSDAQQQAEDTVSDAEERMKQLLADADMDSFSKKGHTHEITDVTDLETRLITLQTNIDAIPQTLITLTVPTEGWTPDAENEGLSSLQIDAEGVSAAKSVAYIANPIQTGSEAADASAREAFGMLTRGVAGEGNVTLYALEQPTSEIQVQLIPVSAKEPVTEIVGFVGGGSGGGGGINIKNAEVTLSETEYTYDGKAKEPSVESVMLRGTKLVEGTDYFVVCEPQTETGTYVLLVLGILKYSGGVRKEWTVKKAAGKVTLSAETLTVKGPMGTTDTSITITRDGDGVITVTSENPEFATAELAEGNKVKVTSVKAGSATVKVHVAEGTNHLEVEKSITVTVQKGTGSISVAPTSVEIIGVAGTTATATLTITGDGAVTFSEFAYATFSRADKTLTVTGTAQGSGTVTITLAETENYTGSSCTLAVSVTFKIDIATASWADIAKAAANGTAKTVLKVGEVKEITINGGTYHAQIIGFDHDELDSSDPKYGDAAYNKGSNKAAITFQMQEIYTTEFRMDDQNDNSCSWKNSEMRVTTMPKFKGWMQPELTSNIRKIKKKTATSQSNSTLITTVDDLFLLATLEVFETSSYCHPGEGTQYEYYKSGNSRIKNRNGSPSAWWCRSPSTTSTTTFRSVNSDGIDNYYNASTEWGVALGFCV